MNIPLSEIKANKSFLRDPVSSLTHLAAAVAALFGLIALLIVGWGDPTREFSLFIYGLSLIMMFSASAVYHAVTDRPNVITTLRTIDHASIYILIAGTYTPFCLNYFNGFWRWGMLIAIWGMAVAGVIVKLFFMRAPRWVTAGVYLVMGWFSLLGAKEIFRTMPTGAIAWLVLGGVLFTLGALIYIRKKPDPWPGMFGFHEIWHIFIIVACLAHFIVIAAYIAPM